MSGSEQSVRRMRWSAKTFEGQRNIAKLEKLVADGLTDEDIAKIFYGRNGMAQAIRDIRMKLRLYKGGRKLAHDAYVDARDAQSRSLRKDITAAILEKFGGVEKGYTDETLKRTLTEQDLDFYRTHPIEFATDCVRFLGKPLVFDEFQRDWILDGTRFVIANKSTRIGLSFASSYRAFHKSIFYPYTRSLFVSIKEDRAKELLSEYVYAFLDSNPELFDGTAHRWETYCEFNNGSKIYSLTSSPSGARGIPQPAGMDIYLDELGLYKSPLDDQMFTTLVRNTVLGDSYFRVWSTPFGQRGKFFEVWNASDETSAKWNGFKRAVYNWRACSRLSPESIELAKRSLDDITYRQEYENEFVAIGEEVIPLSLYESCELPTLKLTNSALTSNPHYLGIDFAMGGKDMMAVVGVERLAGEQRNDSYVVRYIKEYQENSPKRLSSYVETLINKFQPVSIYCDSTGMGIPISRMLRETVGSVITGVDFTTAKKEEMVWNLVHLLRDGRIQFPVHKSLKMQVVNLARGLTPSGQPAYRHISGKRDDLAWALMMAIVSEKRRWSGMIDYGQPRSDVFIDEIRKELQSQQPAEAGNLASEFD